MELKIFDNKTWDHLERSFDWVSDMAKVPQDSIHHAEGDVGTHTRMVLAALENLPEYKQLDNNQREIVWTAALLHDVEKRSTTYEENGRIVSPGHAKKGEFTARQILYREVPVQFHFREQVSALVRLHGLPLWIMEKPNPQKAVHEASLRIDMKLLYLIAKADVLGRTCADQRELLERVELFREYCIEQSCWEGPVAFPSALAKFTYFRKEDATVDYDPYDNLKGEAIMLSGLPGMGKDTLLKKRYPDLPVISLDDIRRKHRLKPDDPSATGWVVQEAKEQCRVFLREGRTFVMNATNVTRQMRSQWIDLFALYNPRIKLVYVEVPYVDWLRQNRNREHPVPEVVLSRLLSKLEMPLAWEAHDVDYAVL